MGMSRLTRDGTAELVSRDQILRHARGQGNIIFPVQLTTRLIHICDDYTYIHTNIHTSESIVNSTLVLNTVVCIIIIIHHTRLKVLTIHHGTQDTYCSACMWKALLLAVAEAEVLTTGICPAARHTKRNY